MISGKVWQQISSKFRLSSRFQQRHCFRKIKDSIDGLDSMKMMIMMIAYLSLD